MLLIRPDEVIDRAFTQREQITADSIRALKIDVAQEKYIRPRFGAEFFDQMCQGFYADFVDQYIKPPLAHYVRYALIDELSIQMTDNGAIIYGKTDEAIDSSLSTDQTENLTRTKTDQTEGSSTQNETGTQTQKINQTDQTEKEGFSDTTVTNFAQDSGTEVATIKEDQTHTVLSDTTVNRNEQTVVSDKSLSTVNSADQKNQNRISQTYRVATLVERRIIAGQALSDANVLLAKAVRYVERNEDQFEHYLPMSLSSRVFF